MWVFLVTEIMFFSGMLRLFDLPAEEPAAFFYASEHMNFWAEPSTPWC